MAAECDFGSGVVPDARAVEETLDLRARPLAGLAVAAEALVDFRLEEAPTARAALLGAALREVRVTLLPGEFRVVANRLDAGTRAAFDGALAPRAAFDGALAPRAAFEGALAPRAAFAAEPTRSVRDDAFSFEERRLDDEADEAAAFVRDPAVERPDFARDILDTTDARLGLAGIGARTALAAACIRVFDAGAVREVFDETDEREVFSAVVARDGFAATDDRDVLEGVDRDVAGRDVLSAAVDRAAFGAAIGRAGLEADVDLVVCTLFLAAGAADLARTELFARAATVLGRPTVFPGLAPGPAARPVRDPPRAVVRRPLGRIAIAFAGVVAVCDSSLSILSTFCLSRATGGCAPDPICLAAPTDFANLDRCLCSPASVRRSANRSVLRYLQSRMTRAHVNEKQSLRDGSRKIVDG